MQTRVNLIQQLWSEYLTISNVTGTNELGKATNDFSEQIQNPQQYRISKN